MGDIQEYAGPLIGVSIISMLLITMPSALVMANYDYQSVNLPQMFAGVSINIYPNLYNVTLGTGEFTQITAGYDLYAHEFTLGEDTFAIITDSASSFISVARVSFAQIFIWRTVTGYDYMTFRCNGYARGDSINGTEMDGDYLFFTNHQVIKYSGVCQDDPSFTMDIFLGWNSSAYSAPSDALSDETMVFVAGNGINNTQTQLTGVALLMSLVTFQMPNIPYPMNYIIGALIVVPLAVLTFKILADIIPF